MQLEKDMKACSMQLTRVDQLNEKDVRIDDLEFMQMDKVTTHGGGLRRHHLPFLIRRRHQEGGADWLDGWLNVWVRRDSEAEAEISEESFLLMSTKYALAGLKMSLPKKKPLGRRRRSDDSARSPAMSLTSQRTVFSLLVACLFGIARGQVKGVNLGGWLLSEPWLTPSLYANTSASDEWHLCDELGKDSCSQLLRTHWKSFLNQSNFQAIQRAGLNTVRIPVGYWAVDLEDYEPYVDGLPRSSRAMGLSVES